MKAILHRVALALILCAISTNSVCQNKGHFLLGGGTSIIIGSGTPDRPSTLLYTVEAGISYDILESLSLTGTIGGFRSVMTITDKQWQADESNGPMARICACYIFFPEGITIRPKLYIGTGYRLRVPPEAVSPGQAPSPGRADGPFLNTGLGADLSIGGLRLGFAFTAELTAMLRPAAGLCLTALLP